MSDLDGEDRIADGHNEEQHPLSFTEVPATAHNQSADRDNTSEALVDANPRGHQQEHEIVFEQEEAAAASEVVQETTSEAAHVDEIEDYRPVSTNVLAPVPALSMPPALGSLEQDLRAKALDLPPGQASQNAVVPGAVAVAGPSSLSQLEQDLRAKSIDVPSQQPPVTSSVPPSSATNAKANTSTNATTEARMPSSYAMLERDVMAKVNVRPASDGAVRPGAVAVSGTGSSTIHNHRRVSQGTGAQSRAPGANPSQQNIEQDMLSKLKFGKDDGEATIARSPASMPGAFRATADNSKSGQAVSNHAAANHNLSQLERDLVSKYSPSVAHARTSMPSANISASGNTGKDTNADANTDGSAAAPGAQAVFPGAVSVAGPTASLQQMEQDVGGKPGVFVVPAAASNRRKDPPPGSSDTSSNDIQGTAAAAAATATPMRPSFTNPISKPAGRSLMQLEDDVIAKNMANLSAPSHPYPGAAAVTPHNYATTANTANSAHVNDSSMLRLEQDVMVKSRAMNAVSPQSANRLQQLESDVLVKSRASGTPMTHAATLPGAIPSHAANERAEASLQHLEQQLTTKIIAEDRTAVAAHPLTNNPASHGRASNAHGQYQHAPQTGAAASPRQYNDLNRMEQELHSKYQQATSPSSGGRTPGAMSPSEMSSSDTAALRAAGNSPGFGTPSAEGFPRNALRSFDGIIVQHQHGAGHTQATDMEGGQLINSLSALQELSQDRYYSHPPTGTDRQMSPEAAMNSQYGHREDFQSGSDRGDANTASNGPSSIVDPESSRPPNPPESSPSPDTGIEAFVADTVIAATSAVVVDEEHLKRYRRERMKRLLCYIAVAVVLIVIVVAIVVTQVGGDSKSNIEDDRSQSGITPTPTATSIDPPTNAPTTEVFGDLVEMLLSVYKSNDLHEDAFGQSKATPQYQALLWVSEEDIITKGSTEVDERLLQRFTLATFYFATKGDEWFTCSRTATSCSGNGRGERWLQPNIDECDWLGVTCQDGTSTIQRISIPLPDAINNEGMQLDGSLPFEIAFLTGLSSFIAPHNILQGSIPSSWDRMSSLQVLRLNHNSLTGPFPSSLLTNNPQLRVFEVQSNQMTGIIPPEVSNLELRDFQVGGNRLRGDIPDGVWLIPTLQSLDLSNTEGLVGEVPAALFNNTGLKEVDVSENPNITGVIPESVGDVASQLQTLSIGHTGMGGTIPSSLFHLNELVVFNVSGAGFHGNLSESFSNLSGLQQLALDNNRFSGPIPVAFDTLLSLKRLTLVGNKLTGTISDAICEQRGVLESDIQFLSADCDGPDPPVTCDCCSMCKPETR